LSFIPAAVVSSQTFGVRSSGSVCHRMIIAAVVLAASASAHVRPLSEYARLALEDGRSRSATLEGLVETLDRSDVIVFVDTRLDPAIPTAETMLMAATASVRYVHVILNPRMTFDERVEYLGHELQHAIEIAQDAAAIDSASVRRRFASIGREVPSASPREKSYETEGARLVSSLVRRELMAPRRASGPR
jgi:hypothetical protein